MKKGLIITSLVLIFSLCFTLAANGSDPDPYETPKIPVNPPSSEASTNSSEELTTSQSGEKLTTNQSGEEVTGKSEEASSNTSGGSSLPTLPTGSTDFEASELPFTETDDSQKKAITKCSVSGIKNKTYNKGKNITQSVTVKDGKTVLTVNKDYKLSYKNSKDVGTAYVIIDGIGAYSGKLTKSFKINPKGTKIKKLIPGTKSFVAIWTKQKVQTKGYQLQYSLSKSFKKAKTITVKKNKTVKRTVKKLKSNRNYYVRIRTFKKINKTNYYSSWSKVKEITIA